MSSESNDDDSPPQAERVPLARASSDQPSVDADDAEVLAAPLVERAPPADAPLSDLQEWMVALLTHNKGLYKSHALSQVAARHFLGNDRLTPVQQVDIYRRQFWLRHTSVLIDHFPGLTGILGQSRWEPVVESYLTRYGRDVMALGDLGKDMAHHLETLPELPHHGLCVDMARLEWAYQEAFTASDDPRLSPEQVAAIPPEKWPQALLEVSSSLHLLTVRYPVARLRRELRKAPSDVSLERTLADEGDRHVVVYRRDGTLFDKELSRPAFLLLQRLQAGVPLIPACEAVVRDFPQAESVFDSELMAWFALWGRIGWIVGVTVPDT